MSDNYLFAYADIIEKKLIEYVDNHDAPKILKDAMKYSLISGGKRIRPCLMLEFYRVLNKDPEDILNFACAIEMIHTYSLIHDDLPCMDDDDIRRGRPSNHIKFGESTALLAGDALLTLAFETAADINKNIKPDCAVKAIKLIAEAAGMCKMIGGQILDLDAENKKISISELEKIQDGKTVALLKVNAQVACALAEADENTYKLMEDYCINLGKAFQIRDDILDVIGDESVLGKPIGSDQDMNKNTYVSLIGIEKSQQLVDKLTNAAKKSILSVSEECDSLAKLAEKLAVREK